MKPLVKTVSTSSQSWKVTVLDTLTRQQTLLVAGDDIRKTFVGDNIEEEDGWNPDDFRIMGDLDKLTRKYSGGGALTALCIDGEYPLFPYWGTHEITKKRVTKFRWAREHDNESIYIGGIRYCSFDRIMYNPSLPTSLPITVAQLRLQSTHVYLFLPLIPGENNTVTPDKMLAHVCGMNWDILQSKSSSLVLPKWSDK
jgi:hypothetical protein